LGFLDKIAEDITGENNDTDINQIIANEYSRQ
jgi:hypothetical protein